MDLAEARDAWPAFQGVLGGLGVPVLAISADSGEGLDELRAAIGSLLPDVDGLAEPPDPAGVVIHRIEASGDGFVIEREDLAFRVRGKRIERLTTQTNFEVEESAERFQRELARNGVDAALRKAGIRPGDAVRIAAVELEWEPLEDDR
jgi:GTP-binding protein